MGNVAKHSDEITDEMWNSVNKFNRDMVQEFLENQTHLSKKTLIQYESGLKIYFNWVKENLNDKNCVEIKKKEYLKYQNYLTRRGLSESAIKFKKSCVSAFNNYIMFMYEEEYPTFRNYVTSEMRVVSTGYVHEKQPLTPDEYVKLCKALEEKEDWQKLAYVMFSYSTGCRRAEARQLLKEIIDYKPQKKIVKVLDDNGDEIEKESIAYKTHDIRCKGRSVVGKVRKLQFGEDVMFAIKKWLEVRGEDDCEYVFVTKKNNEYKQVSEITLDRKSVV